ncbi:MAG: hypothetical protein BroJett011_63060 [Chloroflexota bacterium]|nr:MAG: hypothetical protein BroJett011_63060 [Chloroflexota bacterium]
MLFVRFASIKSEVTVAVARRDVPMEVADPIEPVIVRFVLAKGGILPNCQTRGLVWWGAIEALTKAMLIGNV